MANIYETTKKFFSAFRIGQRIKKKDFNLAYFSEFPYHNLNDFYLFRKVALGRGILKEMPEKDFCFDKKKFVEFMAGGG